jgi:DNA invertase Pin-like site-specific DNA recombinase
LYRNSTDKQENSVDRQRAGVEPYAHRKGYEIVTEYVFDGIPGDEIKKHPDWRRLLKDAGGKWSVLLLDEPSRLSREDPDEFVAEVKLPLKRAGVRVDSVARGMVDWDSIAGDILTIIDAHKSHEEVRTLSRRTLGGMAGRAKDGLLYSWRCPYGLRVARVIDPATGKVIDRKCVFGPEEEVRAIRFIFDAIANRGWSLRHVCRELDARGVKPPVPNGQAYDPGAKWCSRTIRRFLNNRKYVGDLPWNETTRGKYSSWKNGEILQGQKNNRRIVRHDEDDWILVPDLIPPLVDRDTFARAQEAMKMNQKRTSPLKGNPYLFTRTLVCGDCGAFMMGHPEGKGRTKGYICGKYREYGTGACYRNTIREKSLLQSILAVLLDKILDPARLDEIEAEMKRRVESERDTGGIDKLKKQIAGLERNIAQGNRNLTCLPEDRLAGVVATLRALEGEKTGLEARLREVETGESQEKAVLEEARRQLWRLREALEGDDEEAQATVIREVVSKIEVRFTHERTHGKRSPAGKGKMHNRPAGAVLYVRPGLGLSVLRTTPSRCSGRIAKTAILSGRPAGASTRGATPSKRVKVYSSTNPRFS